MKNIKETILESFSKMDIEMLGLILDDSRTYQDAKKEIFLRKLNDVFKKFKNTNDNLLVAHRGRCLSDDCNKGCKGISFIGNNSNNHADFIFEENEIDFKDIYHCSNFKIDTPGVYISDEISLFVSKDEKADFIPSIGYLARVQKCERAYSELIKNEITYISKNDYFYWLEKNHELFKTFELPPLLYNAFDKFYTLYWQVQDISSYLKFNSEANNAIKEYNSLNIENEGLLLGWLIKYESLGTDLSLLLVDHFYNEEELKSGYVQLRNNFNLKISVSDFTFVILFNQLFDNHYWEMLDKYSTIEKDDQYSLKEMIDDYEKSKNLLHK